MNDAEIHSSLAKRDPQSLFDRARGTAVELARLIITLSTGTIAALALTAIHDPPLHLDSNEQWVYRATLFFLLVTIATALAAVASDAASDGAWAKSLLEDTASEDRWARRHKVWRVARKSLLGASAVCFVVGILFAGGLVLRILQRPPEAAVPCVSCGCAQSPARQESEPQSR